MTTGEKITHMAKVRGIKMKDLAEQVGEYTSSMWRWRTGFSDIKLRTAVKIARVLNVTVDEIIGDELKEERK